MYMLATDVCPIGKGKKPEPNNKAGGSSMVRKDRSDMKVDTFERKHGLPPGTVRNDDGRDTRGDKRIGRIRKEKGK
jgi:hypothetical protein